MLTIDELYVNEQYKFGSKEKEVAEFEDHVRRVREAQRTLAARHFSGNPQRVFHTKAHACLAGKLVLLDDRPEIVRRGVFAAGGKSVYNVVARFSSGVGFAQHDLKPDVRGLALKVFGVDNDGVPQTVDFLMTNSTNPFGRDQEEFVQFMEANVNPGFAGTNLIGFLIRHRDVARLLVKATLKLVPSLATEQYWSGHPYLLGPERAMKFNVRPLEDGGTHLDDELQAEQERFDAGNGDAPDRGLRHWVALQTAFSSRVNPDYLAVELRKRLPRGPLRFLFCVQLEKDAATTPIENGLIEWKEEDTPSIPVAQLVLNREIDGDACTNLRFTPGHHIADHRPLGNLARGRIFTYEASQIGRSAPAEEPAERAFFDV